MNELTGTGTQKKRGLRRQKIPDKLRNAIVHDAVQARPEDDPKDLAYRWLKTIEVRAGKWQVGTILGIIRKARLHASRDPLNGPFTVGRLREYPELVPALSTILAIEHKQSSEYPNRGPMSIRMALWISRLCSIQDDDPARRLSLIRTYANKYLLQESLHEATYQSRERKQKHSQAQQQQAAPLTTWPTDVWLMSECYGPLQGVPLEWPTGKARRKARSQQEGGIEK